MVAVVRNLNAAPWTVRVGFRSQDVGADGALVWEARVVAPSAEVRLVHRAAPAPAADGVDRAAVLRKEVQAFGDSEGVLFKRFGPALLWGHWDAERLWDGRAMPFSLRFAVANMTGSDWSNVTVRLSVPEAWTAQGRPPMHWAQADALAGGVVELHLGALPDMARTVAPFWMRGPHDYEVRPGWSDDTKPFHAATQLGPGLTIGTPDMEEVSEVTFEAELIATQADGQMLWRHLTIPVRVVPCR
jgi:hypothetical protein